jgi:hypothetical protein
VAGAGAGVGAGVGVGAGEACTLLIGAALTPSLTLLDGAPFTPPPPQEAIVMAEPALIRARVKKLLADENGMFFKIYPRYLEAEVLKLHHQIPTGGISRDGLEKLREANVSFLIRCDRKIARSCRRHFRMENSFRMDRFFLINYRDMPNACRIGKVVIKRVWGSCEEGEADQYCDGARLP